MAEFLDIGPRVSAGVALAVYVAGLVGAFGVRSWLHRRRTGDFGIRRTPAEHRLGRAGVLLFIGALLLCGAGLIVVLVKPQRQWDVPVAVSVAGLLVCAAGLWAVLAAQSAMGNSWRVGIDPHEVTELVTSGPFALVRNPIFTAMGITLLGVTLLSPSAMTTLAFVTFLAGVHLQVRLVEEPALGRLHGAAYRSYTSRVGRFLPGIGLRR